MISFESVQAAFLKYMSRPDGNVFVQFGVGDPKIKDMIVELLPLITYYHKKCEGNPNLYDMKRQGLYLVTIKDLADPRDPYSIIEKAIRKSQFLHPEVVINELIAAKAKLLKCIGARLKLQTTKAFVKREHIKYQLPKHLAVHRALENVGVGDVYGQVAKYMR